MALMEKPPQPESAEKRIRERLSESDNYGEFESFLVIDILSDEAEYKFGRPIEDLSFGEKTDLTAPETITRQKRNMYSMDSVSDQINWNENKLESLILWKVQEKKHYANSDTALTLDLWIDEIEERFDLDLEEIKRDDDRDIFSELSEEQKKKMTKPESISGTRRKLTREGFLSPDAEVQEERMRKSDRFQDYFRRRD